MDMPLSNFLTLLPQEPWLNWGTTSKLSFSVGGYGEQNTGVWNCPLGWELP